MQRALTSGLSGVRANQQYLDVIGDNLANVNTFGYKASRVTFTNLFAQNLRNGTGPTNGIGGVNPTQVGTGVQLGSVDRNMIQGALLQTGRNLDMGIQGEGFFVLEDARGSFYSRVGAFGLDSENMLVDQRTGFRVQDVNNQDISIVINSVLQGQRTESVNVIGNLPAERNGPLAELLQTDRAFEDYQPAAAAGITNAGTVDVSGANSQLRLRVDGGASQVFDFAAMTPANPAAATLTEIAAFINGDAGTGNLTGITGATASVVSDQLIITSNSTGQQASVLIEGIASSPASAVLFTGSEGTQFNGSESVATATTLLNDLSFNTTDYVAGDTLSINGMYPDGAQRQLTFTFGTGAGQDGETLGDLVNFLNTAFSTGSTRTASVTLNSDGTVNFTSNDTGDAMMSLSINDGSGNTGATNWSSSFFRVITEGTGPDTFTDNVTVFDSTGARRQVSFVYERQNDGSWNVTPDVDPSEGTVNSSTITGIEFDQNGLLRKIPDTTVQITWSDVPGLHEFNLNLGLSGSADGLTQFGMPGLVRSEADGFEAGTLGDIGVGADGTIEGIYSNGQRRELAKIGIAMFTNPEGLTNIGDGLYTTSSNSNTAQMTEAQIGSAGTIQAGALEGSNVDIAQEFVRLIEAQRAFQANARVVSTSDDVLAELVNLVN